MPWAKKQTISSLSLFQGFTFFKSNIARVLGMFTRVSPWAKVELIVFHWLIFLFGLFAGLHPDTESSKNLHQLRLDMQNMHEHKFRDEVVIQEPTQPQVKTRVKPSPWTMLHILNSETNVSPNDFSISSGNTSTMSRCCSANTSKQNMTITRRGVTLWHLYSGFNGFFWRKASAAIHQRCWTCLAEIPHGSAVCYSALLLLYTLTAGFDHKLLLLSHICLDDSFSLPPLTTASV